MIWFLLVNDRENKGCRDNGRFFFDWVVLKGLIMSSFSIVFISRLAGFFLDKVRCTALVCKNSNE